MPNPFFWYDVMTTDVEAAGRFYSEVVGWQMQPQGPDYTVFTTNGVGVAGLMEVPKDAAAMGARPAWMGYIRVADAAAAAEAIRREGGTVHKGPVTVENIITFA